MAHFFMQALTVSIILSLQMFDFENLSQGHQVQDSQSHSMTNINLYKGHSTHSFVIALTVFELFHHDVYVKVREYNIPNG